MAETIIKGKNIYLRDIRLSDTENIVFWRNQDFVREHFLMKEPLTPEMHLEWMKTKVSAGTVVQFIIGILGTETEIGSVYFRDVDGKEKSAEFGIFIGDRKYAGQGYGYEAMCLAMEYALCRMGLETIRLRVLEENKAAMHVYKKYGFMVRPGEEEWIASENGKQKVIFMEYYRGKS